MIFLIFFQELFKGFAFVRPFRNNKGAYLLPTTAVHSKHHVYSSTEVLFEFHGFDSYKLRDLEADVAGHLGHPKVSISDSHRVMVSRSSWSSDFLCNDLYHAEKQLRLSQRPHLSSRSDPARGSITL